jgi:hypothetical protein
MKIISTFSFLFRSILSKSTGHGFFCIDLDFGYINNVVFHNRRFGTCICVWIPPFLHWRWENIFLASWRAWFDCFWYNEVAFLRSFSFYLGQLSIFFLSCCTSQVVLTNSNIYMLFYKINLCTVIFFFLANT